MSTKYMTDSQSESQNAKKKKIREFEDYVNSEQRSSLPEKPKLDDAPSYERMDYKAPDDEEIKSRAESSIEESTHKGEEAIKKEFESLKNSLESGKQNAKENYETKARELKKHTKLR